MGVAFHLVGHPSPDATYVRISGTPAAPVVEAAVVIAPGDLGVGMYSIFSPDGGTTLFAGGQYWGANPALGHCLDKSVDGGATWASQTVAHLPDPNYRGMCVSMHGWQGAAQDIISGYVVPFGVDSVLKHNPASGDFEVKLNMAAGARPFSVWAIEGTDTCYALAATHATYGLHQSLDRGATWSGADAVFKATKTQNMMHLVVDPRDGVTITAIGYSAAMRALHGSFGGGWSEEVIPGGGLSLALSGRRLAVSEDGAVWALLEDHNIYRRDPGTGVWSVSLTSGISGSVGGIWAYSSQSILASIGGFLYWWDGSIWNAYDTVADLGLASTTFGGVWGVDATFVTSALGPDGTARVSTKGGEVLSVTGSWPAATPMAAYFGENGDTTDTPCFFGSGYGYTSGFSADGETVQVIAPPHPTSTTAKLTLVVGGEELVSPEIHVVERTWPIKLHDIRKSFPPWAAVGRRQLELEDLD